MRKLRFILLPAVIMLTSMVGVYAGEHPDSKTQSIEDGCNRTQLGLLGEAFATQLAGAHISPLPSWVYVNGDNAPKTLEGTVLGTHTAGTDLFGVHDTYDLNVDVKPDARYDELLSTRNAEEAPPQIHTEWEAGIAPLFAWPSVGDRVRETGSEIWDCGHWQDGDRNIPESDFVPGDPLGAAGVEPIGGEEIEIHPISELATWRASGNFVPRGRSTAVHARELDVILSNQGGKAKGVAECALTSNGKTLVAARLLAGRGCSTLQPIAGRDYSYDLVPPKRPSPKSILFVQQDLHTSHNAPAPVVKIGDGVVHITVPFASVPAATTVQDLGATWHAWWSRDTTPTRRFRVTLESVTINNNLDGDSGDGAANPSITPEGEWNMFVDVAGNWTNLHDTRRGHPDYVPTLGAVPSAKPTPRILSAASVPPTVVALGNSDSLHVFTDARECDQPGYVDCPTPNELATTGRSAGRTELSLPMSKLAFHSTRVTIHPPLCAPGAGCPEDRNDPAVCPKGCYAVTYRVDDITTKRTLTPLTVGGDGLPAGTTYAATAASTLSWWIAPVTHYGPDQEEENVTVARVIGEYLHRQHAR